MNINNVEPGFSLKINLRVHKYMILKSDLITCHQEFMIRMNEPGLVEKKFELDADENFSYAILGNLEEGTCSFNRINIQVSPVNKNSTQEKNKEVDITSIERQ
jgi:hypothetical protein